MAMLITVAPSRAGARLRWSQRSGVDPERGRDIRNCRARRFCRPPCRSRPCRSASRNPRPCRARARAPSRRARSHPPADARWRARRWRQAAGFRSSSKPGAGTIAVDLRLALGQRARLVDHQRVDLLHPLQRLGVLDQHAGLRAAADADHDRHRRREPERAGAGDDQHADGGDQAEGQARLGSERRPGRKCRDAPRRSPPARTSRRPDRRAAGSARASAARRRPSARSAPAACRGRPCRRA